MSDQLQSTAPSVTQVTAPSPLERVAADVRGRILHTLAIYPKLSPSMLQVGIGTGCPPALWHPILEDLVMRQLVQRYQAAATNPVTKREQTYTILQLPGYKA